MKKNTNTATANVRIFGIVVRLHDGNDTWNETIYITAKNRRDAFRVARMTVPNYHVVKVMGY